MNSSRWKVRSRKREEEPGFFQCEECKKVFTTRRSLDRHRKCYCKGHVLIPPANSTTCDECGIHYTNARKLSRHRYEIHPKDPKMLLCKKCNKSFASVAARKHHEKNCNLDHDVC